MGSQKQTTRSEYWQTWPQSVSQTTRDMVSAEMLIELEATGDAMRFVDAKGRVAWKATPQLRNYLMDLQLDAQEDLEDF